MAGNYLIIAATICVALFGKAIASFGEKSNDGRSNVEPVNEPHQFVVLVTGVSGYVGSHVASLLSEKGHRVLGTVRNKEKDEKWLKDLVPNLELFELNLNDEKGWVEAIRGCKYVMHVASPFPSEYIKNVEEELIKPAVSGTRMVIEACIQSGTVERVVLTSSIAAVHGEMDYEDKEYDETEFTNADSKKLDAYSKSKFLAETAAWAIVNAHNSNPSNKKMELTVVNPGLVLGPILAKNAGTSVDIVKRMFDVFQMPCVPKINFSICDVRDVVLAHFRALYMPDTKDQRFLVVAENMWLKDIARILADEFRTKGCRISTIECPNMAVHLMSLLRHKAAKLLVNRLGKVVKFSNKKMERVLQIKPRNARDTILDTARSLMKFGEVPSKHKAAAVKQKKKAKAKQALKELKLA